MVCLIMTEHRKRYLMRFYRVLWVRTTPGAGSHYQCSSCREPIWLSTRFIRCFLFLTLSRSAHFPVQILIYIADTVFIIIVAHQDGGKVTLRQKSSSSVHHEETRDYDNVVEHNQQFQSQQRYSHQGREDRVSSQRNSYGNNDYNAYETAHREEAHLGSIAIFMMMIKSYYSPLWFWIAEPCCSNI